MKRNTPLTRSPMPRAAKPMKRSKPKYPSAAQLKERRAWAQEQPQVCWLCGSTSNLQVHELASRAQAPLHWCCRENFFMACGLCNCGPLNWLDERIQMALKAIYDGEHYDRAKINALRHRAENAISESDVQYFVEVLTWNRKGA